MSHLIFFSAMTALTAAIVGYFMNLIEVFLYFDLMATNEFILRIAGIMLPVVGAIAGWV